MNTLEIVSNEGVDESIVEQLHSLYAEQAYLQAELGTSNPEELVAIMSSLEEQLIYVYREREIVSKN